MCFYRYHFRGILIGYSRAMQIFLIMQMKIEERQVDKIASLVPLWPLSLVFNPLVCPVKYMYIVYTWRCDRVSECQIYHCTSCGSNWKYLQRGWAFVPTPLRHMCVTRFLPDFWSICDPSPDIRTIVVSMLTRSPIPSILDCQLILQLHFQKKI